MSPQQDAGQRSRAVLDTSVLFDPYVRDVLLNLALDKRYEVHWNTTILEELKRALAGRVPTHKIATTIDAMNAKFPRAVVKGRHPVAATPRLPDPNDRHVLSAAMASGSTIIVTNNLRDFPEDILGSVRIRPMSADGFLTWLYRQSPAETLRVVKQQCLEYSRPPVRTLGEFADLMERRGVDTFTRCLAGQRTSWRASPSFR
ncbi:MAG: PIN domain-containing protein [bacterium]|nr:PIN domain-containing protein [bacterium]